jgi:hypothetical protein
MYQFLISKINKALTFLLQCYRFKNRIFIITIRLEDSKYIDRSIIKSDNVVKRFTRFNPLKEKRHLQDYITYNKISYHT